MASEVNRRTANSGRLFCFRGVTTGPLLTVSFLAASLRFAHECQRDAAPNTYPRVGHHASQQDAATVNAEVHAQETHSYPRAGPSKRGAHTPRSGPSSVLARPKGSLQGRFTKVRTRADSGGGRAGV